jgi:hypothetical protein
MMHDVVRYLMSQREESGGEWAGGSGRSREPRKE